MGINECYEYPHCYQKDKYSYYCDYYKERQEGMKIGRLVSIKRIKKCPLLK